MPNTKTKSLLLNLERDFIVVIFFDFVHLHL